MSQKDVWQKHMGPLKTQVGEADAATSLKTTREKVSPIEKKQQKESQGTGMESSGAEVFGVTGCFTWIC